MAIYKRGDVWWVEVKISGIRVRESAGKGASRKDAQELEARIKTRILDDTLRAKMGKEPRRTFDEALLRWLKGDAATLKDRTIESKARLVLPYMKGKWLEQVPDAADEMKQALIAEGLKPATINRRLALVRRVLNKAYAWRWIKERLGEHIKLLAENNERHIYLTPEEVTALANAAGEARDVILQLAYTGLRLSELFGLTSENVVDDVIVLQPNTKSGKPRVIPIPPVISDCPIPVQITRSEFRTRFEAAREAVGRPGLHAHDLRHTYASLLIQSGAGVAVVRDLLGHSHLGVTSRYTHLSSEHLRDAVEKMAHKNTHSKKRNENGE